MIPQPRTDTDLLRYAAFYAASGSGDPHTRNAAVLARPDDVLVAAANDFPRGVRPRHDRPEKYDYIEHAERAVIYKAAAAGWPTAGATMYCPWFACTDCARAIIAAGIVEVVGHVITRNQTPSRWLVSVRTAEAMLREAGVGMRWLAEPLGVSILFDGKEMNL